MVMRIGKKELGKGGTLVIAEAGVNHNGNVHLAHDLVNAAADAGADAVKFQTFEPALLAAERAPKAEYQRAGDSATHQREMLEALTLRHDDFRALKEHAESRGIIFLSSPFDEPSAAFLDELGVAAFKLGSGELTNHPLLEKLSRTGRPLLVSTGMSDLGEVSEAVQCVRRAVRDQWPDRPLGDALALFHCVSSYPASARDVNLLAMSTLRDAFHVPVGYSDHTGGFDITIAAVALGAEIIEKHLTTDVSLPGPDHKASIEPQPFAEMVKAIRRIEAARGDGVKRPTTAERAMRVVARKSLHLKRPVAAGNRIGPDDLIALRPGDGIAPSDLQQVLGAVTNRDLAAGAQLKLCDLSHSRVRAA